MKIAIVNNAVPFVRGGAEHLADALRTKLLERGHRAMVVRIPFSWEPPCRIVDHMLACRLLRVPDVDRVIALKFPAYYVQHESKYIWLLHQFRQAYDLWGTPLQGLPDNAEGREVRDMIIQSDSTYLLEASKMFANSKVTSGRLRKYNGLESEVLHPPLLAPEQFSCREYGDYVLALGRVNQAKRQLLLVESMRYCRSGVKLIIAGRAETPQYAESVRRAIHGRGLQNKVQFIDRFIGENEKVDLLSRALAVAYIPYDEDSYGYVTLEAFLSQKAVVTCEDSGGILEFVEDKKTGLVRRPDVESLAEAMDQLYERKAIAQSLGEAARTHAQQLQINWDRVIRELTA
jgi:glycosyltransferase involved in cell wall biosynthesis